MKYLLCYFSGSGNTRWLAQQTGTVLKENGDSVEMLNIEQQKTPPDTAQADVIGLFLPIYGFGLAKITIDFIKRLPKSSGQKVMFFASCAGWAGIGIVQALILLALKGYKVLIARPLRLPDTWILVKNPPTEEVLSKKRMAAIEQIRQDLQLVSENKRKIKIGNLLLMPLLGYIYLIFYFMGRFQAGKWFAVNGTCNSCRACYTNCPCKTIQWKDEKPFWAWNCQQCYRCINTCPQAAIEVSLWPFLGTVVPFFLIRPLYLYCAACLPWLKLPVVAGLAKLLIYAALSFGLIWLVDRALHHKLFSRFIPAVYITKNRRRYTMNN